MISLMRKIQSLLVNDRNRRDWSWVDRHNDKDHIVTHGPMIYDIATYHYLYGANPTHNVNDAILYF